MQPSTATEEPARGPGRGVDLPENQGQAASMLEIVLSPRKIARIFIGLVLAIAAVGAVANFLIVRVLPGKDDRLMHLVERFDLDFEPSFCGWYSSIALLFCSILLGTIAVAKKRGQDRFVFHWWTLAILFLLMSIDESVQIHEMSVKSLRRWLGTTGFLYFAWVIPGALFVAAAGLFYLRFLMHLDARTRWLFVASGVIFVTGALGLESVGGFYWESQGNRALQYIAATTTEELLEMLGIVLFMYALVDYIRRNVGPITLRVAAAG